MTARLLVVLVLLVAGCRPAVKPQPVAAAGTPDPAVALAAGPTDVGFELLAALAAARPGSNQAVSPVGLAQVLAPLAVADDKYAHLLRFPDRTQIAVAAGRLPAAFATDRFKLTLDGRLWPDRRAALPSAVASAAATAGVSVGGADAPAAWLGDGVPLPPLPPDAGPLAVSRVRPAGGWRTAFPPAGTRPELFHGPGPAREVMALVGTVPAKLARTAGVTLLELPLATPGVVVDILLPDERLPLADVAAGLTAEEFAAAIGRLTDRPVKVVLPKCQLDAVTDLGPALRAAGLSAAGTQVWQRVTLTLTESGLAPVPAGPPVPTTPLTGEPAEFVATRPFAVVVRSVDPPAVLLLGLVHVPESVR